MADVKRVYHPTLNAWQDVPEKDSKAWKDAGWRLTKPDHADDSDAPAPGEHPGFAQIPVLEDTSPTVTTTTGGSTTTTSTGTTSGTASAS